jgi:hypothetical protein
MGDVATVPCRACSAELPEGARKCDRCGVLQRDDVRCPHCGAVADAAVHAELVFACEACGGPRVPQDDARLRTRGGEVEALRRADAARRARAGWTAVAFGAGGLLALGGAVLGLAALAFGAGIKLGIAAAVLAAPLAIVLVSALRRASARAGQIRPAIEAAWHAAATEIASGATASFGSADLARALRVDEARAEELLALLDASDVVRGTVDERGELTFRSTIAPRLRVDVDVDVEPSRAGDTELAEAEAAATAEADQARARKGEGDR